MKINKLIAMTAIALLAIGVMGFMTTKAHAQSGLTPTAQVQGTITADTEKTVGQDKDTAQQQIGDQIAQDTTSSSTAESSEAASSDGQDTLPTGTPSITSDAAIQAAQIYLNTTASGTSALNDENGKLVYSININGNDVKVDAMSGAVLGVDQVGNSQTEGGN